MRLSDSDLTEQFGNVFGWEEVDRTLAHVIFGVPADHFLEHGVGIDNMRALVRNDDALIQRLENVPDLFDPLRLQFAQ